MSEIRIAGFDPSFANFGIAQATYDTITGEIKPYNLNLVTTKSESGKTVRKNSDDLRRSGLILRGMREAAGDAALAIAEVPTGTQSARASWALGITVGVLSACPIPLIQVLPKEVKLASVGKNNASKNEMIEWAMLKYPDLNWLMRKSKGKMVPMNANEHLADAVAVLHCGVRTEQFKQAISLMQAMSA